MYKTDQAMVSLYAKQSPENFFNVVMLAVASANVPFYKMPDVMQDMVDNGEVSKWLRGSKRDGYLWLKGNHYPLYDDFISIWIHNPMRFRATALRRLLTVPGLGLIKAGFAVQLLLGEVGCIDQHNQELYGIANRYLHYRKRDLTPLGKERKIAKYIEICDKLGGSEYLWDTWCNHMARVYPETIFQSAQAVSQLHWEVLP